MPVLFGPAWANAGCCCCFNMCCCFNATCFNAASTTDCPIALWIRNNHSFIEYCSPWRPQQRSLQWLDADRQAGHLLKLEDPLPADCSFLACKCLRLVEVESYIRCSSLPCKWLLEDSWVDQPLEVGNVLWVHKVSLHCVRCCVSVVVSYSWHLRVQISVRLLLATGAKVDILVHAA